MPRLIAQVWEFTLASKDGKPVDDADAGRIRIMFTDKNDGIEKVEVKKCGETKWCELSGEGVDLVIFQQILKRYTLPPPMTRKP